MLRRWCSCWCHLKAVTLDRQKITYYSIYTHAWGVSKLSSSSLKQLPSSGVNRSIGAAACLTNCVRFSAPNYRLTDRPTVRPRPLHRPITTDRRHAPRSARPSLHLDGRTDGHLQSATRKSRQFPRSKLIKSTDPLFNFTSRSFGKRGLWRGTISSGSVLKRVRTFLKKVCTSL